jgi:hypothetical protein
MIILTVAFHATSEFAQTGERLPSSSGGWWTTGTAPSAGVNCVQTLTIGAPTTGTFRLTFAGPITTPITWVAVNVTLVTNIQNALNALNTINGSGNVTVAAGTIVNGANGTITVTFSGDRGKRVEPVMTVTNNLSGGTPTLTCAITTAGVEADCRICPKGALVTAKDTGKLYIQTGTPPNPVWSIITSTP